ncbi:unnamed protein product [Cyprideis torosa]|uniref:NOT2/NOT3/NOT5 C-terminal domain-containing protein n=1 Tax=Cyprideis torosa TaxID=163714 RepID=A0A7R8W992_9CRUS|nr:unnamed protein product [Cyprideis torosa]CAG0884069.1 unnamed protein product [Cyprideis torosa]
MSLGEDPMNTFEPLGNGIRWPPDGRWLPRIVDPDFMAHPGSAPYLLNPILAVDTAMYPTIALLRAFHWSHNGATRDHTARGLHDRGWRFNNVLHIWMKHATLPSNSNEAYSGATLVHPIQKSETGETASYEYYDPVKDRTAVARFTVHYDDFQMERPIMHNEYVYRRHYDLLRQQTFRQRRQTDLFPLAPIDMGR